MKIAFLIDPLERLNKDKDTSLAMIHSACQQQHQCLFFTQNDMFSLKGRAYAVMSQIALLEPHAVPEVNFIGEQALDELDIIIMRKDPPFDLEYIYTTYMLELAENAGVLVANKPQSLRDANEKFFTLNFPQCCPPTLVTKNNAILRHFWQTHGEVIFKPLAGMGGSGVFLVNKQGDNLSVILEQLTHNETINIMAQQYIPEISTKGDKRILLINGEPIPYALARIPAEGELRGNLAAGATGQVVPINERDRWLCAQIGPVLKEKSLYFVGMDVIGDYLTEINVTSPTCAREIMKATGYDITGEFIDCLVKIKTSM